MARFTHTDGTRFRTVKLMNGRHRVEKAIGGDTIRTRYTRDGGKRYSVPRALWVTVGYIAEGEPVHPTHHCVIRADSFTTESGDVMLGLDFWVKCDRCDRKITCNGAVTEQEARLEARDRGWVKGFNHAHIRDWCPDCGKEKK